MYASYSAAFSGLTNPLSDPSIGSNGGAGGGGTGVGAGGGTGAGAGALVSHTATPPWCEHVPERVAEKL